MANLQHEFFQQLELFGQKAFARVGDPETSYEAARIATKNIRYNQWLVWSTLLRNGPMCDEEIFQSLPAVPMIDTDFGDRVGERSPMTDSGCRTRRKELCDMGLVRWTGMKDITKAGNPTRIWQAVGLPSGGHLNWKNMLPHFARKRQIRSRLSGNLIEELDLEDMLNIAQIGTQIHYYPILPHIGRHSWKDWLPKFHKGKEQPLINQEYKDLMPFEGMRYYLSLSWLVLQFTIYIQFEGPWTR